MILLQKIAEETQYFEYITNHGLGVFVLFLILIFGYKYFSAKEKYYLEYIEAKNKEVSNLQLSTLESIKNITIILDKIDTEMVTQRDLNDFMKNITK